jgi:hypothetical protein
MGELKVTPANARHPKCREYQLGSRGQLGFTQTCRLKGTGRPFSGRRTVNTPIMSILCNAMQFKVQCRMPDPDGVRFRRANPSTLRPQTALEQPVTRAKTPPLAGEGFEAHQVFGFAASIAARLTIWPISLACSASARICACTYSLCSRITSVRSLACSSFSA